MVNALSLGFLGLCLGAKSVQFDVEEVTGIRSPFVAIDSGHILQVLSAIKPVFFVSDSVSIFS